METVTGTPDGPRVDVEVTCDAPELPDEAGLSRWIALAARETGYGPDTEVSVRIVGEAESRALNKAYRGKDRPTNVLSFPAHLDSMPGLPTEDAGLLGDIVLCAPVIVREAASQGKTPADHWAHLLVHGFLHLAGFDHERQEDAEVMEALEVRLLGSRGLRNPYKDRYSS